jgi:hypothetical protein
VVGAIAAAGGDVGGALLVEDVGAAVVEQPSTNASKARTTDSPLRTDLSSALLGLCIALECREWPELNR